MTITDPFEVVEETVEGSQLRVFKHAPRTLRDIWDVTAHHGDAVYLVYEDERHSFTDARRAVAAISARLRNELGVERGDRVAIAMRNYPEWALTFWGAALAGAVVVPLNAWWSGPELAYALEHAEAKVVVCDDERRQRLAREPLVPGLRTVVARAPAPAGTVAFDELASGSAELPDIPLTPDDVATLMYTSGTTGQPKGAVGTHRNIGAHIMNGRWMAAQAAAHVSPADGPRPQPVTLLTFPLFHVGGLHSFLIPYALTGGRIVLLYKWDATIALDLIEREGVTGLGGVPTTLFELLDAARAAGRELPSLAGVASGAAPVPPKLVRRIDGDLGSRATPTNAYGLTETQGAAVVNAGPAYLQRPDSVGRPVSPVVEVRVAGPDGEAVPTGSVGEIWLRGPTIVREYYRDPEATAAAFTDRWFRTGDLGRLDEEGFLYLVDRAKDVIIRGGENVYAAEIEAVLHDHPAIADVAVVGVPDERLGEQVAAVVRLRPGAEADADALRAHVGRHLAAFKVPAVVRFTDVDLPRTETGKVLKRQLRVELATDLR